eukprot:Skav219281  [mRNA]  locus=scaffold2157:87247:107541:- [translate_table: standard]
MSFFAVPCGCPHLPYVWDAQSAKWMATNLPSTAADVVGLGGNSEGDMTPQQLAQDLAGQRKGPVTYAELLAEASRHLQAEAASKLRISDDELYHRFVLLACGIRFVDLPGFKFSLVAETAQDLKAGDTLLRVPSSLHISPSYVRSTELGKTFSSIDDSALLALGLMAEAAKGEESKWWPYIRTMLPPTEELHIPLLWPEEERRQRELLKGSPLDIATEQQLSQLTEQWNDIAAVIKELDLDSNSWTKDFTQELSLIPGLDLANHELGSKNTCSIGVTTADGQVVEARDGPLAEALGAWKAEPKTTYQALQKPLSEKNEERVKQQALHIISTVTAALDELPKEKELKEKAEGSSSSQDARCCMLLLSQVETSHAKMCLQVTCADICCSFVFGFLQVVCEQM